MSRRATMRAVWMAAGVLVVAGAGSVGHGQGQGGEDLSVYLPSGPARAVVAKECAYCHTLRGVLALRKPAKDWEAIVLDMSARGAAITIDDIDPVIRYLADVFGPQSPPFTDVNVATRDELTKVPGVTSSAADKLIAERKSKGWLSSHDDVRAALGLDAAAFDKIKPYLYVSSKPR